MHDRISKTALDRILLEARSHNAWTDEDISDEMLMEIVDITKMGPTSANCSPARFVFVKSDAARERLKPHLSEGNVKKTMTSPVCAIIGYDMEFYEHMPTLFPHNQDAINWFKGKPEKHIETNAFRNGTLQGGYFMIAARALGLDVGPMSGFDNDGVDKEFFSGTKVKSNFLCNLGIGDASAIFSRSPRFDFDEMAEIV